MAEHCHGCNNDQCLGTATVQRLRADLASEKREKLEWMSSSAKALADLEAARAETARLRGRVENALAGGDPSGIVLKSRVRQALTSDPEPTT